MKHGGQLRQASERFGIPVNNWLDISTGIAPWTWPVPTLPQRVWQRLPEEEDGLLGAAAAYYGYAAGNIAALPGSQFAIRTIPELVRTGTVAVPAVGYTEHAERWLASGHRLCWYHDVDQLESIAPEVDHAVLINPNNPTGEYCDVDAIERIRNRLGEGLLVIDAAFADSFGHSDPATHSAGKGTVVLRSMGKFFGLAGLRLGFALGDDRLVRELSNRVRPWGVNHPARWIGVSALEDTAWQELQRGRIQAGGRALQQRIVRVFAERPIRSTGLFTSVFFDDTETAPACFEHLARLGVLVRLGDNCRWLRFGLPGENALLLEHALDSLLRSTRMATKKQGGR